MARMKQRVTQAGVEFIPFTPEEEAQADAEEAAWQVDQAARAEAVRMARAVSPYQARVALHDAGLLPQVEALMVDPATPVPAKLAWEYGITVRRNSAFIAVLSPALGLTEAQVDALFDAAELVE